MDVIEVLEAGVLTMVQDLGRYGFQRYGVPVSGAMDTFALQVANRLVGNEDRAAGVEIMLAGFGVRFLRPAIIAVTGADLDARRNGQPVPMWQTLAVNEGDTLECREALDGTRAYLAVGGGIDVPEVLGSRSTYTRSKFGGLDGRPLRTGDRLAAFAGTSVEDARLLRLPPADVPRFGHQQTVRVVLGPQDSDFSEEGIRTFLTATFTVTPQSDRIGYRLQGPKIAHATGPDIVSDGSPSGAVQVAGDGQPIVLLADRGTTGGYTKIATVIGADLMKIAQAGVGDGIRFEAVSVKAAQTLWRSQQALLDSLEVLDETGRLRHSSARMAAAVAAVAAVLGGDPTRAD